MSDKLVVRLVVLSLFLAMFIGCSSSSSSSGGGGPTYVTQDGVFIDSAVEGLTYSSLQKQGETDSGGTFIFTEGQTVSFYAGGVFLGEALGGPIMSPLDLVDGATDETHQAVINIARFLQSIDDNGNPDDGILISDEVRAVLLGAPPINFDQNPEDFSNDPTVIALFEKLNRDVQFEHGECVLTSAAQALAHLSQTLGDNPTISLLSPNGMEFLISNTSYEISWKAPTCIKDVSIFLSEDGGETWNELVASTPNTGTYLWETVPIVIKNTRNRIRVVDAADAAVFGKSDANFTILLPTDEIANIIRDSSPVDSDGDHLPDDLEIALGTNPDNPDSDRDGMSDYYEILDSETFGDFEVIPDRDNDGIIAALDDDDNGDGVHDGLGIDSDGDGIANYLEFNGYTYDWFSESYFLWDGISYTPPYFKTDPLQPSTDQDPYSDSMETSGRLLDVLITPPGDLPMVPAYPNIVVRLEEYDVTLNSEIAYAVGESLSKESSWSRETGKESGTGWENGYEVGVEIEIKQEGGVTLAASNSGSWSGTNTTSTSSSIGASITSESNWERSTSSNPSQAARIKLKFKVYNYGTAAASNVMPTLTMKIGGMNVLTFQPDMSINILQPGGVYPSQDRTYWVVEKAADGEYIYLTMEELRALELGAPISISVTQMQADVMLLNTDGVWESAGDWSQYMARCEAVSSNILLDTGEGHFIHQLVYSDDAQTSPRVTFGDVLNWVGGGDANTEEPYIEYYDWDDMGRVQAPLEGFHFIVDRETLRNNGWDLDADPITHPEIDTFNIKDLVLGPRSVVVGKVSPDVVNETGPTIHYAFYDEKMDHIVALSSDYLGVSGMTMTTTTGSFDLQEEIAGSGIFRMDGVNSLTGTDRGCCDAVCTAEALNASGETVTATIACLEYSEEQPIKPEITSVLVRSVDPATDTVSLDVQVEEDVNWPVSKVWVYDPLTPTTQSVELVKDLNYWDDNRKRYYGTLSETPFNELSNMVVVAEIDKTTCPITNPDCYDTYPISPTDIDIESIDSNFGTMTIRTEDYVVAVRGLYSYLDFYEEQNETGTNFLHYGEGWGPLYDIITTDNAISAHPEAEILFATKDWCGGTIVNFNVPAFLINARWRFAAQEDGPEWTREERTAKYNSFTAGMIAEEINTLGWHYEPYSVEPPVYQIPELYSDFLSPCPTPKQNQFLIIFFEIPETDYVVKFMFHEYSFTHLWNWSDTTRYTYDVYNIGSSGTP